MQLDSAGQADAAFREAIGQLSVCLSREAVEPYDSLIPSARSLLSSILLLPDFHLAPDSDLLERLSNHCLLPILPSSNCIAGHLHIPLVHLFVEVVFETPVCDRIKKTDAVVNAVCGRLSLANQVCRFHLPLDFGSVVFIDYRFECNTLPLGLELLWF